MSKYIIVAGGVLSGVGKGIATASIAYLMKQRGYEVQCIKLDPYLNVNAGIMSPNEHGEVWVTDDGSETDLDLGNYARIGGIEVSKKNIYTSGALYKELIHEQEQGDYLGETVQVVPHCTNKIIHRITSLGKEADIVICEIGGTVGDLESAMYYEAIRKLTQDHSNEVLLALMSPILWMSTIKEFKTKPLQQSVKALQSFGLQPDMLLCRVDRPVPEAILDKVSRLTGVPPEAVFDAPDVQSIYQVPIEFYNRHVDGFVVDHFHLKRNTCKIHKYKELVEKYHNSDLPQVTIGIVGKYANCEEAYLSLKEAVYHAGVANDVKVDIKWFNAEDFEQNPKLVKQISDVNGVIIPGGFDGRGIKGKMMAIQYSRENKIPLLGICLGLQCAVIEFARNVCKLDADSVEFNPGTSNPVVHYVEGQESISKKSGTMRLGAYDCNVSSNSLAMEAYRRKLISERHRHRYEFNNKYTEEFEEKGFIVSGRNPKSDLVEIMELSKDLHPFFICTQAHPEFKSILGKPNPLFKNLVFYAAEDEKKLTAKSK